MKPGDLATCGNCGAQARAESSAPARWRDGDPLVLAWPATGVLSPRTVIWTAPEAPDRCQNCFERFMALGMDTPPPGAPGPERRAFTPPPPAPPPAPRAQPATGQLGLF